MKKSKGLHKNEKVRGDMQPLGTYKDYFIEIGRHMNLEDPFAPVQNQ